MKRIMYPFLFAVFPVLFLFAYNIDEVPATDLLLPIGVVIVATLILFFLLRLVTKNYIKSGIITSFFLILFFSYGRIRDLIVSLEPGRFIQGHIGLLLAPLWVLLFITGAFLIIKSRRNFATSTKFLNITAITLVTISLINISIYQIRTTNLVPAEIDINKEVASLSLSDSDNIPDIYYIILDGYARASTLRELYDYDNSEFIDYLTNKGFYVASKSRSNYVETRTSLPSSLNMEYINYLSDMVGIESTGATIQSVRTILCKMVPNNKVSQLLKSVGYRYIFIGIPSKGINECADVYGRQHWLSKTRDLISEFSIQLIKTTAASYFMFATIPEDFQRERRLYEFDTLAELPNIKEPTFVFAHLMSPHPPWLFDRDGSPAKAQKVPDNGWEPREAYVEQLIFINEKVKTLVDEILSKSDIAPIIILQGDHGPHSTEPLLVPYEELTNIQINEGFNILNAYFLPENGNRLLYESITPVNSFRIVFNLYFDTNYELLKDESYFSSYEHPHKLILVPPEND